MGQQLKSWKHLAMVYKDRIATYGKLDKAGLTVKASPSATMWGSSMGQHAYDRCSRCIGATQWKESQQVSTLGLVAGVSGSSGWEIYHRGASKMEAAHGPEDGCSYCEGQLLPRNATGPLYGHLKVFVYDFTSFHKRLQGGTQSLVNSMPST